MRHHKRQAHRGAGVLAFLLWTAMVTGLLILIGWPQ